MNLPNSTPPTNTQHNQVLKRLDQVATRDYPFPIPPKPPRGSQPRLNLTSKTHLWPVFCGLARFGFNLAQPILLIFSCIFGGSLYWQNGQGNNSMSAVCFSIAALSLSWVIFQDVFFLHWLSSGKLGNLAQGGTWTKSPHNNSNNENNKKHNKDDILCNPNAKNQRLRNHLLKLLPYHPVPYLYSADLLTLWPFLFFKGSQGGRVFYQRWWVKVPSAKAPDGDQGPFQRCKSPNQIDCEAVAMDVSFPKLGYNSNKPTYLILHGLNGGSTEPYVLDLVRRVNQKGCTAVVMINRGLMKTPLQGMESFTGARTSDIGCVVDALWFAFSGSTRPLPPAPPPKSKSNQDHPKLICVGFSMGGILAANYTAKSHQHSGFAASICFSGTLCSNAMLLPTPACRHSLKVWQPALAWGLKQTIVKPQWTKLQKRNISVKDVEAVKTVVDLDRTLVCQYHSYENIHAYYQDMSAGGLGDEAGLQRLHQVSIPMLVVHAVDDPIAPYQVVLPDCVEKTRNVLLMRTQHGGHIGWPRGWSPRRERWGFMMEVVEEFTDAVLEEEDEDEEE